ncbi:MAG: error-prone DNA polymerase [Rudaea sp.]|nr:error-prone DNA polymerase [Rudaea sp.]
MSPHRFGRQARINEHPREIGEPSARVVERLAKTSESVESTKAESSPPVLYIELHCLSNFSFQRGASSAKELFDRAKRLGYGALAITDECSLAGIVRAFEASKDTGLDLIVGTEVKLSDGPKLVVLAADHAGYSDICRMITAGRRCSAKGEYRLTRTDAEQLGSGVRVLWTPGSTAAADAAVIDAEAKWIMQHFRGHAWLAVELHRGPDDNAELSRLQAIGARHGLPLVAAGDVHMHVRRRRALQDVMTAIRLGRTVAEAGHMLFPNGERHLRGVEDIVGIYPAEMLGETLRVAAQCKFHMSNLAYKYPNEIVPPEFNGDATEYLRQITYAGATQRLADGVTEKIRATLEKELALIKRKKYEAFFLTVYEIVNWARTREKPILCQGRGSSANSAVCYCLGITAVSPAEGHLLFERFLSDERNEPPDIDVDFEHERREEVIQHIFDKYGRERAALAATVISYRSKSALRDVGRALGLSDDALDQLSSIFTRVPSGKALHEAMRERGFDPDSSVLKQLIMLARELRGFPRHLSQHVGGFVISERALHELVPVENAAMPNRTIIQWDRDDLESMQLLKVDCLALGMLTCLRKCFDLLRRHEGTHLDLHQIPQNDLRTYEMIRKADTVGVFQIESRAQMSMLPRLKPEKFYDLVIEVAIVRPGPIQGQMVHPYLNRRKKPEDVDYPKSKFERESNSQASRVKDVLERTLGVPIFQEQVMELLQVVADFTADESNQLRRSMAAWRRQGGLEHFHDRIFKGMDDNGYSNEFAKQIYRQIQGFGEYGFPESHSYSFALLAYASSWLKCHRPAFFTCALLNSQPMGFYQPSQLIQDAQQHGVLVLPVDVTISDWYCTLERIPHSDPLSLRLGMHQVKGLSKDLAERLIAARDELPFADVADMTRRARVTSSERACLADANTLRSLSGHRHRARWDSAGAELPLPVLANAGVREEKVDLRPPSLREDVMSDYATQGLSLTLHPLALIRPALARRRVVPAHATTEAASHGRRMRCAGLVTVRQHPGTAKGVTFVTLEDETGHVNVVVWRALAEKQHRVLLESSVLGVDGTLQASEGVYHLIAERLHDYSALLPELSFASRDFH